MPFEKDYNNQAKVVKYLLTAQKELAKLQKEMSDGDKVQAELIKEKQREVTYVFIILETNLEDVINLSKEWNIIFNKFNAFC